MIAAPAIDGEEVMRLALAAVGQYRREHPTLPPHSNDDVVSDAMFGAASAARRWTPDRGASAATFIRQRAYGAIVDGRRQNAPVSRAEHARGVQLEQLPAHRQATVSLHALADAGVDVVDHTDAYQAVLDQAVVDQLLALCDDRERQVLTGLYLRGLTGTAVAAELGVTHTTVRKRARRALARIRNLQETTMPTPPRGQRIPSGCSTEDEISFWLDKRDREFAIDLGETTSTWTAADVDAVIADRQTPAAPERRPQHYPDLTPARPRPAPTALVASAMHREAAASVALDGQTHALDEVDSVPPPDQEPADDNSGAPVRPSSTTAGGTADPVATTSRTGRLLHPVTVDVGEVAHAVVQPRGRDLLAEGLAHGDRDVVAAARRAQRAVDQLATLLLRQPTRGDR